MVVRDVKAQPRQINSDAGDRDRGHRPDEQPPGGDVKGAALPTREGYDRRDRRDDRGQHMRDDGREEQEVRGGAAVDDRLVMKRCGPHGLSFISACSPCIFTAYRGVEHRSAARFHPPHVRRALAFVTSGKASSMRTVEKRSLWTSLALAISGLALGCTFAKSPGTATTGVGGAGGGGAIGAGGAAGGGGAGGRIPNIGGFPGTDRGIDGGLPPPLTDFPADPIIDSSAPALVSSYT